MNFQAYYWWCCPCCCPCKGIKFRSNDGLVRSYRDNKYRIGAAWVIPSQRRLFFYIQDSLSIFVILTNYGFPGDSFVPILLRSWKLLLVRSFMKFQFDIRISSSPRQDNQNNGQMGRWCVLSCPNFFRVLMWELACYWPCECMGFVVPFLRQSSLLLHVCFFFFFFFLFYLS